MTKVRVGVMSSHPLENPAPAFFMLNMSINDKIGEKGKESKEKIDSLIEEEPKKKLSREEKERLIKEEVGKAQYYESIGMI